MAARLGFGAADGSAPSTSGSTTQTLGTTRNRTELFLKYRRQARGSSSKAVATGLALGGQQQRAEGLETARLMASALGGLSSDAEAGLAGVAAALPPQYVEFKEVCRGRPGWKAG